MGASVGQTTFPGTNLGPVPDGPTGCYSTPQTQFRDVQFNVTGMTAPLTAVSVSTTFNPAHTWAGDLTFTLISPGGVVSFPVVGRIGATTAGGCGTSSDFAGPYTFQNGTTSIWTVASTTPIPSGTYCPNDFGGAGATNPQPCTNMNAAFATLTTAQINGTWTLRISDGSGGDTGTVSAATLTLTGTTATPPVFGYTPPPGSTVTATGGSGIIGTTSNLSIAVAVATPGTGTGAPATTTLTCTAPTAPFAGFGQTVTAVGSGAISGGPLAGTCTRGATAVTQTLTCTENQGGTAVTRTWTLNCPAGSPPPVAVNATSVWSLVLLVLGLLAVGTVAVRRQF
jgi:subtilisin-like proprotein convertase family protein